MVGEGKEAIMMAAKRVCGRHSSLVWNGVGMKRMGVLMGVLRRARMCLQRWGGGASALQES